MKSAKKYFFMILTLSMLSPLSAEGGLDFSSEVETKWASSVPWADQDYAGHFLLGDTSFTGSIDAHYDSSSAYAEGSVSYDALQQDSELLNLSISELWIDYTDSFWGIRIGRQKAAWGKADGIDITNILCPQNMESFSAMTGDNSKLAIDALRLSFNGNSLAADFYWIPFFSPASLPLGEGNSLRKFVVPSTVDFSVPVLNETLSLPVSIGTIETPEVAIWNGEYGLRLSGYFSIMDVSLYGFYGWDDVPFLDYTILYSSQGSSLPSGISVSGSYEHLAMLGADAAIPIGETVLRLEGAFFPQRHFQKTAEDIFTSKAEALAAGDEQDYKTTEQHNQVLALAGLDWMPNGWTLTAQYFCDYVYGDLEKLSRSDAFKHGVTVSISKTLLAETLELSVNGMMNFNAFDSFICPSVKYGISDQISLSGGAYIFIPGPEKDGEYGVYKNLSSFFVGAKMSF